MSPPRSSFEPQIHSSLRNTSHLVDTNHNSCLFLLSVPTEFYRPVCFISLIVAVSGVLFFPVLHSFLSLVKITSTSRVTLLFPWAPVRSSHNILELKYVVRFPLESTLNWFLHLLSCTVFFRVKSEFYSLPKL